MTARALRMLYREIPEVRDCQPACARCCGPVPWTPAELTRVQDRVPESALRIPAPGGQAGTLLLANPVTGSCALLGEDKRCTVYEARPFMCRIFGAADAPGLTCPFGAHAQRPLAPRQARSLTNRYKREAP